MHQTIDYNKIPPEQRQAKALEDIKSYLSVKKFNAVTKATRFDMKHDNLTRDYFVKSLSMFVGIEGYPAEAWADYIGFPAYPAHEEANPPSN